MRRVLLCAALSAVGLLALVPCASANKNKTPVEATCSNGKTYTVVSNDRSNVNGAILAIGVGPAKVVSVTGFEHGTSNVLFTDQSNFPKAPNLTCRATFTGVDPDTGQPFTIDVEAQVYAKRT